MNAVAVAVEVAALMPSRLTWAKGGITPTKYRLSELFVRGSV